MLSKLSMKPQQVETGILCCKEESGMRALLGPLSLFFLVFLWQDSW